MSIDVLIADDHRLVRQGLRWLLERETDIQVIGEADDGMIASEAAAELHPHVVLMDVVMPNINGIEATQQIVGRMNGVRVLGISAYQDRQQVASMLEAGACGFLLKSADGHELIKAIHTVVQRRSYLSPEIAGLLVESYVRREYPAESSGLAALGPRERQVLQMVAEGHTSKDIAIRMSVTRSTVESHRRNIMRKLNLKGVAEMTRFAIRAGLTSS